MPQTSSLSQAGASQHVSDGSEDDTSVTDNGAESPAEIVRRKDIARARKDSTKSSKPMEDAEQDDEPRDTITLAPATPAGQKPKKSSQPSRRSARVARRDVSPPIYSQKLHPQDWALRPKAWHAKRYDGGTRSAVLNDSSSDDDSRTPSLNDDSSDDVITDNEVEVKEVKRRKRDPKATRRSSRKSAGVYREYRHSVHPQDRFLPFTRKSKIKRELDDAKEESKEDTRPVKKQHRLQTSTQTPSKQCDLTGVASPAREEDIEDNITLHVSDVDSAEVNDEHDSEAEHMFPQHNSADTRPPTHSQRQVTEIEDSETDQESEQEDESAHQDDFDAGEEAEDPAFTTIDAQDDEDDGNINIEKPYSSVSRIPTEHIQFSSSDTAAEPSSLGDTSLSSAGSLAAPTPDTLISTSAASAILPSLMLAMNSPDPQVQHMLHKLLDTVDRSQQPATTTGPSIAPSRRRSIFSDRYVEQTQLTSELGPKVDIMSNYITSEAWPTTQNADTPVFTARSNRRHASQVTTAQESQESHPTTWPRSNLPGFKPMRPAKK